jgi:hypothetical protein
MGSTALEIFLMTEDKRTATSTTVVREVIRTTVCPQSPFGVSKIEARKQIELATSGLRQIIVKL